MWSLLSKSLIYVTYGTLPVDAAFKVLNEMVITLFDSIAFSVFTRMTIAVIKKNLSLVNKTVIRKQVKGLRDSQAQRKILRLVNLFLDNKVNTIIWTEPSSKCS